MKKIFLILFYPMCFSAILFSQNSGDNSSSKTKIIFTAEPAIIPPQNISENKKQEIVFAEKPKTKPAKQYRNFSEIRFSPQPAFIPSKKSNKEKSKK